MDSVCQQSNMYFVFKSFINDLMHKYFIYLLVVFLPFIIALITSERYHQISLEALFVLIGIYFKIYANLLRLILIFNMYVVHVQNHLFVFSHTRKNKNQDDNESPYKHPEQLLPFSKSQRLPIWISKENLRKQIIQIQPFLHRVLIFRFTYVYDSQFYVFTFLISGHEYN